MRFVMVCLGAGLLSIGLWAWYERYYRWRACFNELGRCYDSETATVYLEQAGIAWMLLALIGALILLPALRAILRHRR